MKIGILVPSVYMSSVKYPEMIFAPKELAVNLADGLAARGHEVTLFASPDTKTRATLVPGNEQLLSRDYYSGKTKAIGGERHTWSSFYSLKETYEGDLTARAYRMAREGKLDIIHSYHDHLAHFFEEATGVPTVYTLHDPLPSDPLDTTYWLYERFRLHRFIAISESQKSDNTIHMNFVGTIYHGVRIEDFPFAETPSDYVIFMGRLVPEKGLHDAIQACIATNTRLEIGTQFPDLNHENEYFTKNIKPYLSHPMIGEPGMVKGNDKMLLYKEAKAILFPIHWEEPFGMVMIEALACGTPVIAYDNGSVPEIVEDGTSGFIINSGDHGQHSKPVRTIREKGIEGLVAALNRTHEINRRNCRKRVEDHFTVSGMAAAHEIVYRRVLENRP